MSTQRIDTSSWPEGEESFVVYAEDAAGNNRSVTFSVSINNSIYFRKNATLER